MSLKKEEIQVVVEGVVQGVGFRWATRDAARRRGLRGWVRNLPEGTVEALAQGPGPEIDAFVEWLHAGPPAAKVSSVRVVRRGEPSTDLSSFEILR